VDGGWDWIASYRRRRRRHHQRQRQQQQQIEQARRGYSHLISLPVGPRHGWIRPSIRKFQIQILSATGGGESEEEEEEEGDRKLSLQLEIGGGGGSSSLPCSKQTTSLSPSSFLALFF
jgi:hypothetical protein